MERHPRGKPRFGLNRREKQALCQFDAGNRVEKSIRTNCHIRNACLHFIGARRPTRSWSGCAGTAVRRADFRIAGPVSASAKVPKIPAPGRRSPVAGVADSMDADLHAPIALLGHLIGRGHERLALAASCDVHGLGLDADLHQQVAQGLRALERELVVELDGADVSRP